MTAAEDTFLVAVLDTISLQAGCFVQLLTAHFSWEGAAEKDGCMSLLPREPVDTYNKLWEDEAEGVLYGWPFGLGSSDCRYRGALGSTLAI